MSRAEIAIRRCLIFYGAQRFGELGVSVLAFLDKLGQFARASLKRCKDKNLDKALQILNTMCKGFWVLNDAEMLPLLQCVLVLQLDSVSSSSSFQKLGKIIVKLSNSKENICSQEVEQLMKDVLEEKEVLLAGDLEAVCIYLQESASARGYLRRTLPMFLQKVAATFQQVLQDETAKDVDWEHFTVKVCLQLFQVMPDVIRPLVWSSTERSEALQSILVSLVQMLPRKMGYSWDLAGTAVSMLVNTSPEPDRGAQAVRDLFQLLQRGTGKVMFGMLTLSACTHSEDGLLMLPLIRGLLTCGQKDILTCAPNGSLGQGCLLLDVLFPALSALFQEKNSCQHHSLQVLTIWLQRLKECAPDIWRAKEKRLLTSNSELLQKLSQLIWINAENPVDGVSVFLLNAFQNLLDVYLLECHHFGDIERPLFLEFLQKIIAIPWQRKVRYPALCALLPYVGPEKVLDVFRELPHQLLLCLSTNYLCPPAAELYKTLVELQRQQWTDSIACISEEELAQFWAHHWLPTLSDALTSSDSFLRNNAANYLLVCTLRIFPAACILLAEGFQGMDSARLWAWLTVLSVRKMSGVVLLDGETLEKLSICIHCEDEAVRLATLGILCHSPKTNQTLSEMELDLLRKFLPQNLTCDSSRFRQLLQASLKKALVRQRDSSLAILKSLKKMPRDESRSPARAGAEKALSQAVDFVQWLLKLSISSLTPGSNFQRKKTALLLLSAILETCTDSWSPERKKGQPPQHMVELLGFANEKGCWDFFSTPNLLALLSCCRDSTDEIRELAAELFIRYFPPTFPESFVQAVFKYAQESMCSSRVQEAEAGALIMKILVQRSDRNTLSRLFPQETELALFCSGLCYAQYLLQMLNDQYAAARQDLLQAASERPMHGVILALRRCLLEVPEVLVSMVDAQYVLHWKVFLRSLVKSLQEISEFLLQVINGAQGSSSKRPVAAPSLADMGNAINLLISQGGGLEQPCDVDGEEPVLLSEEHGLLMTCCWVSFKEVGLLLGSLVENTSCLVSPAADPLLSFETLETVAGIFQDALLGCRHWGAVEGCSMGLTKYCTSLLRHPDPVVQELPKRMLTQALALLRGLRSSSLTRRAAGFPMLILGIVSGEQTLKSRLLLKQTVQDLLTLSNTPLPANWNQTLDLPQVSAVHVLQTLVRSSCLGSALLPFTTPALRLALRSLGSPCWAMRNAALQLFSSVTARMLGPTLNLEDSLTRSTLSPQAFFTEYPQLRDILLQELHWALESCDTSQKGTFHLCPSLHSVLTLLAKLQPGDNDPSSYASPFLEPLIQLAASPVYSVRVMAAKALISLASVTQYKDLLQQLVGDLPTADSIISHNALHGHILQIEAVLAKTLQRNCLSLNTLLTLTGKLEEHFWLVTPVQRCPLIRAAYLQVISLLTEYCTQDFTRRLQDVLYMEVVTSPCGLEVGLAVFRQLSAHFLCKKALSPERYIQVCQLLRAGDPDVQLAVLSWVMEHADSKMDQGLEAAVRRTLQEELTSVLCMPRSRESLILFLQSYLSLHRTCSTQEPLGSLEESVKLLLNLLESGFPGPDLQGHAICVASLLLFQGQETKDISLLERWCRLLVVYSDPCSCEALRVAAARALRLAGSGVVQRALGCAACSPLSALAVRVIGVGIKLLKDQNQLVRREASVFASLAPHLSGEVAAEYAQVQSIRGQEYLLQLLLEHFWESEETLQLFLQYLPSEGLSSILSNLENSRVSLYEQDEPNVSSETAVFSCVLLPFLLQLVERIPKSVQLCAHLERWIKDIGASVVYQLHYCRRWWSQNGDFLPVLRALCCPKVCTAVTVLLVKAAFLTWTAKALEFRAASALAMSCSFHDLTHELKLLQALLAPCGMCPNVLSILEPLLSDCHQGGDSAANPEFWQLD
ncbi:thyroid adenoma-associated protein homolog [Microcaecilia unicolor]|uniref:Thyroid adenoma-associated protein homolog n=1 Tax=Microcaecilia unicolor TaxID=1415580 RepID=A0A6P7ZAB5_9AMPH|nr:thyroid adenoma-associated protein homolog [Microcaecilia unicolor]